MEPNGILRGVRMTTEIPHHPGNTGRRPIGLGTRLLIWQCRVRFPGDPHMKLNEIVALGKYEPDTSPLLKVVTEPARDHVDTFENKSVYKTVIGNQVVYDIDGQAMVVGVEFKLQGQDAFRVGGVVTLPESRGKGYASALYKSLVVRQRITLVSDDSLTQQSIALWKSIAKVCKVSGIERDSMKRVDLSSVDDAINGDPNLLLIATNESLLPEVLGSMLEQTEYYTHPDNTGQWE